MATVNYEAGNDQMEDRQPIPAGEYDAMIVESDVAQTRAGNGTILKITWQIQDGVYQGRKVFDNINLDNPNAKAVEIGRKQLNTICHAVGIARVEDSAELHDRPCRIKVGVRPPGPDRTGVVRGAQNEVKFYAPVGEPLGASSVASNAAPARQQAPPQQRQTAPATAGSQGKPPWARK